MMSNSSSEWQYTDQLVADRNRLLGVLIELREAAISRQDFESHDVTDDEAALQGDAIEARLAAIGSALQRIESGSYGRCLACGSAIEEIRLQALPVTTTCRDCAR